MDGQAGPSLSCKAFVMGQKKPLARSVGLGLCTEDLLDVVCEFVNSMVSTTCSHIF